MNTDMMTLEKFYSRIGKDEIDWISRYRLPWMTDDQWLLYLFLQKFFMGFHHVPRDPKEFGRGIEMSFKPYCLSNYDADNLTRLVIMAHNWGVRVEISGSSIGHIKLKLWKRHSRAGDISEAIPTIDCMVDKYKDL